MELVCFSIFTWFLPYHAPPKLLLSLYLCTQFPLLRSHSMFVSLVLDFDPLLFSIYKLYVGECSDCPYSRGFHTTSILITVKTCTVFPIHISFPKPQVLIRSHLVVIYHSNTNATCLNPYPVECAPKFSVLLGEIPVFPNSNSSKLEFNFSFSLHVHPVNNEDFSQVYQSIS